MDESRLCHHLRDRTTRKNDRFLRFVAEGVPVHAAYRKAGYRGSYHAAYQLKSRLALPPLTDEERAMQNEAHRRARAEWIASAATRPKPEYCEVCGQRDRIFFEHDHTTGKFRGWLCRRCNTTLGFVSDSPELLEALAKYLRDNKS